MAVGTPAHLPDTTHLGRVRLRVRDLDRSLEFYEGLLGMARRERSTNRAVLSSRGDGPELVVLEADPAAADRPRRTTGLYHFALLYPDRASLAAAFLQLARHDWPFQGFADHLVSEAIYLADPDGNGIELYADRPRLEWRRVGQDLAMDTLPLDLDSLVAELGAERDGPFRGMAPGTVLGHVHLHVSDLSAAEAFYSGVLGFEVTVRGYPGALFFAAGGYHHHVGTNIWAGRGAPRPPERAVGLLDFSIHTTRPAAAAAAERAQRAGWTVRETEGAWCVTGLDGVEVRLVPAQ
ncbi:MAG: VOC family protein [Firmicutes bacterium]|nr:VOC family protein [Bacillota bacterium]